MNEKINITKSDNTQVNADIICFLENIKTGKRYAYYTLNETSGTGTNSTVKIYVSKINQNNPALDTAISDEDWNVLKGYMSDALKGNANPDIKYLPLSELGTPISVSEKAIAMPTSYDYINKQRGIYAQNVATIETTPEPTETIDTPVETPVDAPIETPVATAVSEPIVTEPTPAAAPIEPTVQEETPEPAPEVQPIAPTSTVSVSETEDESDTTTGGGATLTPINLEEIEQKYTDMIKTINDLKEKELDAARRYNATIELSAMHTEQHANYVQSEQNKEVTPVVEPTPATVEPSVPTMEPATQEQPAEPTPITLTAPVTDANLETNWFDMPAN